MRGGEVALREKVLMWTAQYYHGRLLEMGDVRGSEALRGIGEEALREFQVGVAVGGGLEAHLRRFGVGREVFAGRVVFPTFSRGRVVYLTGRVLEGGGPKYLHLRGPRPVYNDAALRGDGELVLVEGITDCLVLHGWGIAAMGLQGTSLPEALIGAVAGHEPVYVCLDGDEAGREGGERC